MDRIDQNLQQLRILVQKLPSLSNDAKIVGSSLSKAAGSLALEKIRVANNSDQRVLVKVQGHFWQKLRIRFWKKS